MKLRHDETLLNLAINFKVRRYTEDTADPGIGMPRGEVLIGGPIVCQAGRRRLNL